MIEGPVPLLRVATTEDIEAIDDLIAASIRGLFPSAYSERQVASSLAHIDHIDERMIVDGTCLVIEEAGELVACGGWSPENRLVPAAPTDRDAGWRDDPDGEPAHIRYVFVRPDRTRRGLATRIMVASEAAARAAGYRRLVLRATLVGIPLYERCGFVVTERTMIELRDGARLEVAEMEKRAGASQQGSSPRG